MSYNALQGSNLNPTAQAFRPNRGFNVFADPFVPSLSRSQHSHSMNVSESSLNIFANVFVPTSTLGSIKVSETEEKSQISPMAEGHISPGQALAQSITRQRAENGQFVKRPPSWELKRLPSEFPISSGGRPSFVPAGNIVYDGAFEDQRQKYQLSQNAERVIRYNWKGLPLCADGKETPGDRSDTSRTSQMAEDSAPLSPTHHFNWLGQPVPFKSDTPSAVSLVVIMSLLDPKGITYGPHQGDLYRKTLFKNALATVDPVIYYGDDPTILADLQGSALQEAATGSVAKMYSRYGCWHDSQVAYYSEDEEMPLFDHSRAADYIATEAIANGWYGNFEVPTIQDFIEFDWQVNVENALRRRVGVLERMGSTAMRSRLDQVTCASALDATPEAEILTKVISFERGCLTSNKRFVERAALSAGNSLEIVVLGIYSTLPSALKALSSINRRSTERKTSIDSGRCTRRIYNIVSRFVADISRGKKSQKPTTIRRILEGLRRILNKEVKIGY